MASITNEFTRLKGVKTLRHKLFCGILGEQGATTSVLRIICVGRTVIRRQIRARPILRGTKITTFLLSALVVTVLSFGMFTRPTQADFLDPVAKTVGCLLNITSCTPDNTTPQTPADTAPADTTPSDDPNPPAVAVDATPTLAGGTTQVINITGTVIDSDLDSYSLAINGTVAQQESAMTNTQASINIPWNIATPNLVPSGAYTITLDATDKAGHTAHTEKTVTVDNTPPAVTIDGGDVIIKDGSISPTVTASDDNGIASYAWTESANNPATLNFDHTAAMPTFTPTYEGSYLFTLAVTDGLGNVTDQTFTFGYQQELATVPLPTTTDPTDGLVDQSPSTPAVTPASTSPVARVGRDEITTSDDSGVLGNTVTAPGQLPPTTTAATITPTAAGWSIFGLLWYWWLVILGVFFAGWILIKKFVLSRVPEHS
jgi:hypothetical protein